MAGETQNLERHLIEMITLAGEYCITLENAENSSKEELYTFLHKVAPLLYLQGLLFPETDEPDDESDERMVTEEQWENVFNALRSQFGPEDTFLYLDPPEPGNTDVLTGSLSELYSDVYQDLKDFMWLMTKKSLIATRHAAYDIKKLFLSNWGAKLLRAQTVLHSRMYPAVPDEDYLDLD